MSITLTTNPLTFVRPLEAHGDAMRRLTATMSSGLRIATAADDPAGLAISERLRSRIRSFQQADRNVQDGVSLLHVAEAAMGETGNLLIRMRELAVQAASGTLTSVDRATLDTEFDALRQEIDRIARATTFNGIALLDGTFGITTPAQAAMVSAIAAQTQVLAANEVITFEDFGIFAGLQASARQITLGAGSTQTSVIAQINADATIGARVRASTNDGGFLVLTSVATGASTQFRVTSDTMAAADSTGIDRGVLQGTGIDSIGSFEIQAGIGLDAHDFISISLGSALIADLNIQSESITTTSGALAAMIALDSAQQRIAASRGGAGALINRLASTRRNLATAWETESTANSRIRDVDMAVATSELVRRNILREGTVLLFRRASEMQHSALQLLSNAPIR